MAASKTAQMGATLSKGAASWRPLAETNVGKNSRANGHKYMIMSLKSNAADDGVFPNNSKLNMASKNMK